eukprot:scaffold3166_cov399-Prasinococcus_capsulatus_cf.AAC.33
MLLDWLLLTHKQHGPAVPISPDVGSAETAGHPGRHLEISHSLQSQPPMILPVNKVCGGHPGKVLPPAGTAATVALRPQVNGHQLHGRVVPVSFEDSYILYSIRGAL